MLRISKLTLLLFLVPILRELWQFETSGHFFWDTLYNQFQIWSGLQLVHDLLFEVLREKREEKKVINIIDESYFYINITLVKNFQSLLKVESTKT